MDGSPGLVIRGLKGLLTPGSAAPEPLLRVQGGELQIHQAAANLLLPPGLPLRVLGIASGGLRLRVAVSVGAEVEAAPHLLPDGWIRLQPRAIRAMGILPLPASVVMAAVVSRLPGHPGVRGSSGGVDLYLPELLAPLRIQVPPPRELVLENSLLRIRF